MLNTMLRGSRMAVYLLAMALVLSLAACDSDDPVSPEPPGNGDDDNGDEPTLLIDIIDSEEDLSGLSAALADFGLTNQVADPEVTITVFAPSNTAFQEIIDLSDVGDSPLVDDVEDFFGGIVAYHVTDGEVLAGDLSDGQTITPLRAAADPDAQLNVSIDDDGSVRINGAPVSTTDLTADNGVIHIIDGLLLENRSLPERLGLTRATNQLAAAALSVGAGEDIGGLENATLFAPRNIQDAIADAELDLTDEELASALQYHVIVDEENGLIDSDQLGSLLEDGDGEITVSTEQGEDLTIVRDGDDIVFNGGQAILDQDALDKFTDNFANVFHVIDGVLLPPSIVRDNADAISYDLAAQSNNGAISDGVNGTATFWRYGDTQTIVTLELTDGATGASVSHPAHIHNNSAEDGGDIAFYLTPIDGSDEGASSARVIDVPFDELVNFDGYINIHESVAELGNVVSQGNIGANAFGTAREGLDFIESPRTTDYDLAANANDGSVAPDGIPATATFLELTSDLTLVTLDMDTDGETGANVSHPAHIHNNTASESGDIAFYLGPIDGTDPASRSSKIVPESYDTLTDFNGYINIHESLANLSAVVSQGNIGINAGLISIAEARALNDDAEVTIGGTLTRAKGRYLFIQDDTAGLLLFDFDGFNDQLDAGDLAIGDEIRIDGRMDTFNEQRQIRIDDDAFGIEVVSSGNELPNVPTITLNELNSNPEDYIHQLVRVENFTIDPDGDAEFQAGGAAGNYDIDDGTATSVLRLEGNNSSEYEGEPIPGGEVTFQGAVTQFQGTYQLHLALESDLIVE